MVCGQAKDSRGHVAPPLGHVPERRWRVADMVSAAPAYGATGFRALRPVSATSATTDDEATDLGLVQHVHVEPLRLGRCRSGRPSRSRARSASGPRPRDGRPPPPCPLPGGMFWSSTATSYVVPAIAASASSPVATAVTVQPRRPNRCAGQLEQVDVVVGQQHVHGRVPRDHQGEHASPRDRWTPGPGRRPGPGRPRARRAGPSPLPALAGRGPEGLEQPRQHRGADAGPSSTTRAPGASVLGASRTSMQERATFSALSTRLCRICSVRWGSKGTSWPSTSPTTGTLVVAAWRPARRPRAGRIGRTRIGSGSFMLSRDQSRNWVTSWVSWAARTRARAAVAAIMSGGISPLADQLEGRGDHRERRLHVVADAGEQGAPTRRPPPRAGTPPARCWCGSGRPARRS